ncbi:NfeD family protein [Verrucomicrobiota bacterium sgz303538]
MWPIILCLLILGAALLLIEVFIPGLVVGTMGVLALVGATVLTYMHEGTSAGNLLVFAELIAGTVFMIWWFWYVPKSGFAKRWTLHSHVPPAVSGFNGNLIGRVGEAVSVLRPAGIAAIDGQRVAVVSEGDLIQKGEALRVIQVEGNRVVVRRESCHSEISA